MANLTLTISILSLKPSYFISYSYLYQYHLSSSNVDLLQHRPSNSYADLPPSQIITKYLHLYEGVMVQSPLYVDQICTMEVAERKTEYKVVHTREPVLMWNNFTANVDHKYTSRYQVNSGPHYYTHAHADSVAQVKVMPHSHNITGCPLQRFITGLDTRHLCKGVPHVPTVPGYSTRRRASKCIPCQVPGGNNAWWLVMLGWKDGRECVYNPWWTVNTRLLDCRTPAGGGLGLGVGVCYY